MNLPASGPADPMPRLLVVDDEEIVLVALRETLRRQRYDVVAKSNPAEAIEELERGEFAVIITDQQMPMLTGLELLAHARQLQPDATRILITAVLSLDTVIDAINKGEIYRFIVKPWLREELLVTVKNAVQRYELIRQNARLQASTQAMNQQLVELNHSLEQQVKLVARQNEQQAMMNQTLERNLARSIELSVHTLQTFYPALGRQARHVTQLCRLMGEVLDLTAPERHDLETAALLHDLGLVGVPRSLIRRWQEKPESLDPAETALIEQHPILGQELATFDRGMEQVGLLVRAHHERYDGGGYPDRLAGDKIPWLARLLAVAVAYASNYHTREGAEEGIKHGSGVAFDPNAVRALMKALAREPLPRREKIVALSELRPGMVLARGIYAANGFLIAPEGQPLNAAAIEKLLNHHRVQPIAQSLLVFC